MLRLMLWLHNPWRGLVVQPYFQTGLQLGFSFASHLQMLNRYGRG